MGQEKDKNPFFKPLYKALCGFLDCSGHQKRLGQLWNMGTTKTKCPSFPLLLGSTQQNSNMAYLALNSLATSNYLTLKGSRGKSHFEKGC